MSQRIRRLLVLGGGSEIAGAFVERCIEADLDHLVLAGRAGGSLDDAAGRLLRDHPDVRIEMAGFDAEASDRHHAALRALHDHHGPFDTVLVAFGRLGAPFTLDQDPAETAALIQVNFTGAVSASLAALSVLRNQGSGRLVVLSSTTTMRPRRTSPVYASAKAGLDVFLRDLQAPAAAAGVNLTIVRPGFVCGRMTEGRTPGPFATTPAEVADDMFQGVVDGKPVVYSPHVLAPVGRVMDLLPASLWRRIADR